LQTYLQGKLIRIKQNEISQTTNQGAQEMLKHPTKEQAIENCKEIRRNSRRAINRCKSSVIRYEWHLTQIEESEAYLLSVGAITQDQLWRA
jgi:hypothetical protein